VWAILAIIRHFLLAFASHSLRRPSARGDMRAPSVLQKPEYAPYRELDHVAPGLRCVTISRAESEIRFNY
jgi:hypothetical protein